PTRRSSDLLRCSTFRNHNSIDTDTIWQQFYGPLSCQSVTSSIRSCIGRSIPLPCLPGFGGNIDNTSLRSFQSIQRMMRHQVIMNKVLMQRSDKSFIATGSQSYTIVLSSIVYQNINTSKSIESFLDSLF